MTRLEQIELIRQRALAEIKVLLPDLDEDDFEVEINMFPTPQTAGAFWKEAQESDWLFDRPNDPQMKGWCKSTAAENGGCVTVYL